MKKIILSLLVLMSGMVSTQARETVLGSKLSDNLSLGVAGGAITPASHAAFFGNMRPVINMTLGKQITPILGLALEAETGINSEPITGFHSATAFDLCLLSVLGQFNLTNLFGGYYTGKPRPVEFVAVYGIGWGHSYSNSNEGPDDNYAQSKAGMNINFNVSEAWQINLKPGIAWNLDTPGHDRYNVNRAGLELSAGLTYKFKNSYGGHNLKLAHLYDQSEVDALNAKVNDLRQEVNLKNGEIKDKDALIKSLQDQLADCRNQGPKIVTQTNVKTDLRKQLESVVTFGQGKSAIDRSQLPNVERIATYLKNHKSSKVVVKGYASPEGSQEINARLAKQRAEAVKTLLVSKYGISASRISASGQGVGNMFSEPDWNRVSISTIEE